MCRPSHLRLYSTQNQEYQAPSVLVAVRVTELIVSAGNRPARVLVVCDAYPAQTADPVNERGRDTVRTWRATGAEVLVLAANPQPPGLLPSGCVQVEEVWVDGVTVYQARFSLPARRRVVSGHGAEPLLRLALEGTLRRFAPDLLCLVLGPLFGAIPLRKAAEQDIPVEIVDTLSILSSP